MKNVNFSSLFFGMREQQAPGRYSKAQLDHVFCLLLLLFFFIFNLLSFLQSLIIYRVRHLTLDITTRKTIKKRKKTKNRIMNENEITYKRSGSRAAEKLLKCRRSIW